MSRNESFPVHLWGIRIFRGALTWITRATSSAQMCDTRGEAVSTYCEIRAVKQMGWILRALGQHGRKETVWRLIIVIHSSTIYNDVFNYINE